MIDEKKAEREIRRNALFLRQFTASEMMNATGLPPETVLSILQELEKQELIVPDRSQQEAAYRLSDDPEKRLALSRSIEDFYPPPPARLFPSSVNYFAAVKLLDRAERTTGKQRERLLAQAERHLEGAWQDEGANRAPNLVLAHISYQLGRLSFLRHDYTSARRYFQKALRQFKTLGLKHESRLSEQYLNALTDIGSRYCE